MRNTTAANALGVLVLAVLAASQPAHSQDSKRDLEKRVDQLEQRVAQIERLLRLQSVTIGASVPHAEARLAAAHEKLKHTDRLHKKGYVTRFQLDADRFAVARAQQERQLVRGQANDAKTAHEIDVLDAEHNLAIATERLRHSERLFKRGFATDVRVKADQIAVENARQRLDATKAKRKAQVDEPGNPAGKTDKTPQPDGNVKPGNPSTAAPKKSPFSTGC